MTDMREILPDNPASRLLSILHRAIEIEYDPNVQSCAIWADVLNTEVSPSELLPAYAQLFVLVEEAYTAVINFYPKQEATHEKWRIGISNCLQTRSPYHHKWVDVVNHIAKSEIIDLLQVAADNLSHYVLPTYVDSLSIDKLKEEITTLKEKISLEESFNEQLKRFLINELENILHSLEHFELYGSSPIRDSIYSIVSNSELESNNSFTFHKQLCGFLIAAATAISVINDVTALPDSLEFLKDKISKVSPLLHQPSQLPKKLTLPKEIAYLREDLPE